MSFHLINIQDPFPMIHNIRILFCFFFLLNCSLVSRNKLFSIHFWSKLQHFLFNKINNNNWVLLLSQSIIWISTTYVRVFISSLCLFFSIFHTLHLKLLLFTLKIIDLTHVQFISWIEGFSIIKSFSLTNETSFFLFFILFLPSMINNQWSIKFSFNLSRIQWDIKIFWQISTDQQWNNQRSFVFIKLVEIWARRLKQPSVLLSSFFLVFFKQIKCPFDLKHFFFN